MPEKQTKKKRIVVGNFADEQGHYRVVIENGAVKILKRRRRFFAPVTDEIKTFDWQHGL